MCPRAPRVDDGQRGRESYAARRTFGRDQRPTALPTSQLRSVSPPRISGAPASTISFATTQLRSLSRIVMRPTDSSSGRPPIPVADHGGARAVDDDGHCALAVGAEYEGRTPPPDAAATVDV